MDRNPKEPWLRETLMDLDPLRRQVLHALQLAAEDIDRWCAALTDAQMASGPVGIAPVGFHLRHIARSLDRLLTYAEGNALTELQRQALQQELAEPFISADILAEVQAALTHSAERVLQQDPSTLAQTRFVGTERIPTTAGSLLVHVAEHTQRHVGQAITTAQIVTRY